MRSKRVDLTWWGLKCVSTMKGVETVALVEYEPDPAGRGDYDTKLTLPWPTLRELVRRYELLADYTPDPDVVAAEDAG